MPITINGSGTLTGLSAGGLPDSSITSDDIAAAAVTPAKLSQPLTLATAQNTTSGTSIDFTGIPSWVRRITVMFNGVSTSGSSNPIIQLGAGSITTSGYNSFASFNGGSNGASSATTGFHNASGGGSNVMYGMYTITLVSGTTWLSNHAMGLNAGGTPFGIVGGGSVTLSGTLDRLRLTTVNGTDAFDAGSVNIMYEG